MYNPDHRTCQDNTKKCGFEDGTTHPQGKVVQEGEQNTGDQVNPDSNPDRFTRSSVSGEYSPECVDQMDPS